MSATSIVPHGGRFCLPPFHPHYVYAILDESGRIVCPRYALYVSRQYLDLIERAPNPGRRGPGLAWGGPLPGPPAPAPGLGRCRPAPGSALRLRPALRPKSNKKGVVVQFTGIEQNSFCCSVLGWPGVAPAGGGPPAVRPPRPLCASRAPAPLLVPPGCFSGGSVLPYGARRRFFRCCFRSSRTSAIA